MKQLNYILNLTHPISEGRHNHTLPSAFHPALPRVPRLFCFIPAYLGLVISPCLALVPSGPLVITGQQGTIIENLKITSTTGDCVTITGSSNITIRNSEIGPCTGSAVVITQSTGVGILDSYIHPEAVLTHCCDTGDGVLVYQSSTIQVQGNVIAYGESNVVITSVTGARILGNFLLNPRNFVSRGQNVAVGSSSSVLIDGNYTLSSSDTVKYKYAANQEDSINLDDGSTGVTVSNNYLTGGNSPSGCGIIAEYSASQAQILNNVLVDTGQCGIGIADGVNNVISGNRIINSTPVPGAGNSAIYVWRGDPNSGPCSGVSITNNIASQLKPNGVESGFWDGGGCAPVTLSGNTFDEAARALLSPAATKLPPPLIPGLPASCVPVSPFSNQTSAPPCNTAVPAGAGVPVSDNFNSGTLNLSLWKFINPLGDGSYSANGSQLLLTAPAGSNHDPGYNGMNNAVGVMQAIGNGDFTVDVKFDSLPKLQYQFEGLLVEQDAGNYLRFQFGSTGNALLTGASTVLSHVETPQFGSVLSIPNGTASLWIRLQKFGSTWTLLWSTDGSTYNTAGSFTQELSISAIGPFAGNYNASAFLTPAFTVAMDSFVNTSAP